MSELQLQIFVVQALIFFKAAGVVSYHCPNGEYRNKRAASKLKAMGTRPGVPDLCFVLPPDGRAAYLELKTPKGKLSKEQKHFRDEAVAAGAKWATANTPEMAADILLSWGVLVKDPLNRAEQRVFGRAA